MIEFLKIAAPAMSFVNLVLVCVGLLPPLRSSKGFKFICGEFMFVTAILFMGLATVRATASAPYCVVIWFTVSSLKFAHATFLAKH